MVSLRTISNINEKKTCFAYRKSIPLVQKNTFEDLVYSSLKLRNNVECVRCGSETLFS